jgi:hypothetical protein
MSVGVAAGATRAAVVAGGKRPAWNDGKAAEADSCEPASAAFPCLQPPR